MIAKMKGQNDFIMVSNNVGGTALHVAADVGLVKVSLGAQKDIFM